MANKRTQIIARIVTVMEGLDGIQKVVRDRAALPEKNPDTGEAWLPGAIVLDGKESRSRLTPKGGATQQGSHPAVLMDLMPQIFVMIQPRDFAHRDETGPELDAWDTKVKKAILTDENLIALVGGNGEISYQGHDTDMQTGSTIDGSIQFHFVFTYAFNPSAL